MLWDGKTKSLHDPLNKDRVRFPSNIAVYYIVRSRQQ